MSTLNPETRAVIETVLEALDIPFTATVGHDAVRQPILSHRLLHTMVCLRSLLDRADSPHAQTALDSSLADLREQVADHPAEGYVTYEQAQQALGEGMDWMQAVAAAEKS